MTHVDTSRRSPETVRVNGAEQEDEPPAGQPLCLPASRTVNFELAAEHHHSSRIQTEISRGGKGKLIRIL